MITSIRDAAGDGRMLYELKTKINKEEIEGPDIHYAVFMAGLAYFERNDREQSMVAGLDTTYAAWMQCITPGDNLNPQQ